MVFLYSKLYLALLLTLLQDVRASIFKTQYIAATSSHLSLQHNYLENSLLNITDINLLINKYNISHTHFNCSRKPPDPVGKKNATLSTTTAIKLFLKSIASKHIYDCIINREKRDQQYLLSKVKKKVTTTGSNCWSVQSEPTDSVLFLIPQTLFMLWGTATIFIAFSFSVKTHRQYLLLPHPTHSNHKIRRLIQIRQLFRYKRLIHKHLSRKIRKSFPNIHYPSFLSVLKIIIKAVQPMHIVDDSDDTVVGLLVKWLTGPSFIRMLWVRFPPTTGLGMKALPSRTIKFRNLVGAAVVRKV
jgi:hypothetical protein